MAEKLEASSACPICGQETPHKHSDIVIRQWRQTTEERARAKARGYCWECGVGEPGHAAECSQATVAVLGPRTSREPATPDRSDDALAEENRGRPFSEWHEDHGQVLWWKLPISEAPYCGSPLDLGRTMEVTVQIGREGHVFPFVNTGGWPFSEDDEADLWWTPLPKPTFARAALKGDGL